MPPFHIISITLDAGRSSGCAKGGGSLYCWRGAVSRTMEWELILRICLSVIESAVSGSAMSGSGWKAFGGALEIVSEEGGPGLSSGCLNRLIVQDKVNI